MRPLRTSVLLLLAAFPLLPRLPAQNPGDAARFPGTGAPQPVPPPQQGEAPLTTLRLGTRIVVLDVVVTDKQGHTVNNLTKDDFTVIEDKQPQTIRSFEPPAEHTLPAGVTVQSAADLKRIGDAPVTILVLDELNTRFEDMVFVRDSVVKYLEAQPAQLRQPTILLAATNTRFVQLHDYTQDREALLEIVRHRKSDYPTKKVAGSGPAAVERMAQTLASLEQIAQASGGTPGRKNLIWVGDGFPSVNVVGVDDRTRETIEAAVHRCTDMLLSARVTMYTIDPRINTTVTVQQLTPDDMNSVLAEAQEDPFANNVQFSTLGPATGGLAFFSRNDLQNELAEGINEGSDYYTLSYSPTGTSEDAAAYRKIHIVMRDPNLHAVTRNGYYPPTRATQNPAAAEPPKQARAQLELDLSNAVNSAMSYNGLELKALKAGENYVLSVAGKDLQWSPAPTGGEKAEVTALAAWYDAKGKLLGHSGKELVTTRAADVDQANPPKANFLLPAPTLPPGVARLRMVVRDAVSGRMGTVDLTP